MKNIVGALILVGSLISSAAPARIVITGSTLDCLAGKEYHTPGVEVFIFAESPQLRMLIDGVLKSDDSQIFDRFNKLMSFVKAGKALAHTKSDRNGSFKTEIPPSEKLIVIGYMETEDNPLYWMYSYIDVTHQSSASVILDYCKRH